MAIRENPNRTGQAWKCHYATRRTRARVLRLFEAGQPVRWHVCHLALPRPLKVDAKNPAALSTDGADAYNAAWRAI